MRWELAPWSKPWTGPAEMRGSNFRSSWEQTLALLSDETERMDSGLVVIELDVHPSNLSRNRQVISTGSQPTHPGVLVSFDSRHGPQHYATAEYWNWRHNVRAIALALGALRAVDRYGVSHGKQYVGFRPALAAADSKPEFSTPKEAVRWLTETAASMNVEPGTPADVARRLVVLLHPDNEAHGKFDPDGTLWPWLLAARSSLEKAGVL